MLALSLITNMGCGLAGEALSHEHTLAVARNEGERAARLLAAIIDALRSCRHGSNRSQTISAHREARIALACLDLTSLNDGDSETDIERLCERAQGRFGEVAAVCVWPRFAAFARARLPQSIAVAAVANFPDGSADVQRALRDTGTIVDAGAQEVDVVLPYRALMAGDTASCSTLLDAVRARVRRPGAEGHPRDRRARRPGGDRAAPHGFALAAGADFLKTSTGKTPVSATLAGGIGDARGDRRGPERADARRLQGRGRRAQRGRRSALHRA